MVWMFGVDNCLRAGVSPRLVLSQCLQPARRSRCHRCAHLLRHRVRPTKPVSARGRGRYLYRVEWGVKLYSNSNTRTSHKTRRCITRRARIVCGRVCVTVRCPSVSLSVRPSLSRLSTTGGAAFGRFAAGRQSDRRYRHCHWHCVNCIGALSFSIII